MDFPLLCSYLFMVKAPADLELPLYLHNCGHEIRRSSDYYQDGRKRLDNAFIWQYTLKGRGELRLGDTVYPILPGEGMVIKVPSDSCYCLPDGEKEWDFVYFTLSGKEANRMADEFQSRFGPVVRFSRDGRLLKMVMELFSVPQDRLLDLYTNSATAYRLLMELLAEAERGGENEGDKLLRKVSDHILVNMERMPDIAELSELAGCSQWHFSRKFREISGRSPGQFICELKMQYAARLLEETLDSVKEVALKCGYDDPSYFCRVFRRYHHVSPGRFREADMNW